MRVAHPACAPLRALPSRHGPQPAHAASCSAIVHAHRSRVPSTVAQRVSSRTRRCARGLGALPRWRGRGIAGSASSSSARGSPGSRAAYELAKAGVRATLVRRLAARRRPLLDRSRELRRRTGRRARRRAHRHDARGDSRVSRRIRRCRSTISSPPKPTGSRAAVLLRRRAVYDRGRRPRLSPPCARVLRADAKILGDDLPTYRKHTPRSASSIACRRRSGSTRACPAGRASRFGQLLVNAYGEELGGDPDEISAITVVGAARRIARRSLLAVRGVGPALPRPRRQRPDRDASSPRTSSDASKRASRLVALARRSDGRYRVRRSARRRRARGHRRSRDPRAALHAAARRRPARRGIRLAQDALDQRARHGPQHEAAAAVRGSLLAAAASGNGEYRLRGSFQTTWEVTRAQARHAPASSISSPAAAPPSPRACCRIDTQAAGSLARARALCAGVRARVERPRRSATPGTAIPWSLGSYALIKPGQYTSFYGVEGEPRGPRVLCRRAHVDRIAGLSQRRGGKRQRAAGEVLASLGAKRVPKSA